MTPLSAVGDRPLHWVYPDEQHREFVLRAGSEEIGRLEFCEQTGTRSIAEIEGRKWVLESADHPPRVVVRPDGVNQVTALFTPCPTGGGMVLFAAGMRYRWSRASLLSGTWCFRCETAKSSVCVSQKAGPLKNGADLKICPDALGLPDAPILVLLAWYLRVIEFERLAEHTATVL